MKNSLNNRIDFSLTRIFKRTFFRSLNVMRLSFTISRYIFPSWLLKAVIELADTQEEKCEIRKSFSSTLAPFADQNGNTQLLLEEGENYQATRKRYLVSQLFLNFLLSRSLLSRSTGGHERLKPDDTQFPQEHNRQTVQKGILVFLLETKE